MLRALYIAWIANGHSNFCGLFEQCLQYRYELNVGDSVEPNLTNRMLRDKGDMLWMISGNIDYSGAGSIGAGAPPLLSGKVIK